MSAKNMSQVLGSYISDSGIHESTVKSANKVVITYFYHSSSYLVAKEPHRNNMEKIKAISSIVIYREINTVLDENFF